MKVTEEAEEFLKSNDILDGHADTERAKGIVRGLLTEIERLKEKDRLHCEDCAYNGICETPHTDKSPLCAEYSIVR